MMDGRESGVWDTSSWTTLARLLIESCWCETKEVSASVGEVTLEGLICLLKASENFACFSAIGPEADGGDSIKKQPGGVDFVCGAV